MTGRRGDAGAESLTQIQQAQAIGKAIGQPVRFGNCHSGSSGDSPPSIPSAGARGPAEGLASYVGQTECITPDLEKIIGRPATSYAQWAVQPADAYR